MYLLRRHFGISAFEAEHVIPAWEIEMLLEELVLDQVYPGNAVLPLVEPPALGVDEADDPDAFASLPAGLRRDR